MKKLTFLLALMFVSLFGVQNAFAAQVYTSYNSSTKVLTYYYDDNFGASSRPNSEKYDQDHPYSTRWADYHDQVKKVIIDASMKNATLSKMERFFVGGTVSYPLSNMTTITGLDNLNTANVTSMYAMFQGCYKLQSLNLSSFNTSKVTDMSYMFYDCRSLTSLDFSSFNTANVTGMYAMFESCFNLQSLNLSSFKTLNVTHMGEMFQGCYSLTSLDVSHFNTSKVTNMVSMFDHCEKLQEINVDNFDVSKVENISKMFFDCQALRTIYCSQDWSMKNGLEMFNNCLFLVGGDGTAWSEDKRMDAYFARPDDPANGKPGYFTSTICPEPTNVKASNVTFTSARISWNADESAKNFYVRYYPASNNTNIKEIETTSTSCTLTNLESGEKYYVYVVAQCQKDVTSNDNPTKIYFTTRSCTAPTNLKYSNVTENSATISWTPGASDQTKWYITYKSKDQSDFYSGEEVSTTSFMLNNLQPETEYEVKVKAICSADSESEYSESIFFTTPKPVASVQAYTLLNGTVLTYYYDNKYEEYKNAGKAVQMYYGTGGCATDDYCEQVQTINIDPSMKNYTPEKMRMMFCSSGKGSMSALNAINGIENLNTSNVTDMSGMFMKCGALEKIDLSSLNTSNVVSMNSMFYDCEKLATITGIETLNTSKVTHMTYMFEDCYELVNLDLHKWDVSNVVDMRGMFAGCEKLATITGIETLNTSKVTNMQYMFVGCDELVKLDLHKWDVSNVTNMTQMFCSCKNLKELNLTGFDVSNVENMFCMFFECQNLTTIYCEDNWKDMATKLTESRGMFSLCEALMGGNNTIFSNSNPSDITYARPDGGTGDEGYFTKKERELYGAFTDASKKTLVLYYDDQKDTRDYLSEWPSNYSGVDFRGITKAVFDESIKSARPTTTEDWFYNCETLASIEHLEYLNTSKVTTMYNMFRYCKALTAINVNSFDISSLTSTTYMFSDCENLVYIISDKTWNTGAITDSNSWGMFDGCEKLKGGNGTTYVSNKDKIGYAHPDVAGDPGYFITEAQYKTATGMESVQPSAVSIQKVIENGVLYILRDGKMYNVMGIEVK